MERVTGHEEWDAAAAGTTALDNGSTVDNAGIGRRTLALVVAGACLGVVADRLLASSSLWAARPAEARAVPQPPFSHVGNRIIVPDGSPLRTLLAVAAPDTTDVSHTLVLPAVVEADPARTVRVLPPVTGRVTELRVQLGMRVTQGDVLAVIDSGAMEREQRRSGPVLRVVHRDAVDHALH